MNQNPKRTAEKLLKLLRELNQTPSYSRAVRAQMASWLAEVEFRLLEAERLEHESADYQI